MPKFEWLEKLLGVSPGIPEGLSKDPWSGCNKSHCVYNFRRELNRIAEQLSYRAERYGVYARFNRNKQCAELYTRGGVIARVEVLLGEKGNPYYLIIVEADLSENSKALFKTLTDLDAKVEFRQLSE